MMKKSLYDYDTDLLTLAKIIGSGSEGGGGGGKNILSGETEPTSSIGDDGDIYLQYKDGFVCDPAYYTDNTKQRLCSHSADFYKVTPHPAIAVHYHHGGWYGPILISTMQDAVKYTQNLSPTISVDIDGYTWYMSSSDYWNGSQDNPTIPKLYDLGIAPSQNTAEQIIRAILNVSNASMSNAVIYASYCKVNGAWRNLIGTDINDVNTHGGGGGGGTIIKGVSTTVSGGYNGGAVITIKFDNEVVFTATASDTYNQNYNKTSETVNVEGHGVQINVTPPSTSAGLLGIVIQGANTLTYNVPPNGSNTSYGYNFSEHGTLNIN